MAKEETCLKQGIFALSTVKKLENVFDRDKEKLMVKTLL